MNANENIDTVKNLYDAFVKGDVATILDNLTDDVDWATEAASDLAPWYGQRKGKDAVAGFFEGDRERDERARVHSAELRGE